MGRKFFFIFLLLALTPLLAWSEDARVLPGGTLLLSLSDLMISSSKSYDYQGSLQSISQVTFNNVGATVEFGISSAVTVELNWTPGINIYAGIDNEKLPSSLKNKIHYAGLSDMNAGVKVLLQNNPAMRTSVGAGLSIPLDNLDSKMELDAFLRGEEFRISSRNKAEVLAIWTRFFWDFNLGESFFLNLYSQFYYQIPHKSYYKLSMIDALSVYFQILDYGTPAQAESQAYATLKAVEHQYIPEVDLEADLHYHKTLANGSTIDIALPLNYKFTPETRLDGYWDEQLSGHMYTLNPSLSFGTNLFYLPIEMKIQFSFPLWGMNKTQTPLIALQGKVFLDFY